MARWGMVIDLDKCVGCGTCMATCRETPGVRREFLRFWLGSSRSQEAPPSASMSTVNQLDTPTTCLN